MKRKKKKRRRANDCAQSLTLQILAPRAHGRAPLPPRANSWWSCIIEGVHGSPARSPTRAAHARIFLPPMDDDPPSTTPWPLTAPTVSTELLQAVGTAAALWAVVAALAAVARRLVLSSRQATPSPQRRPSSGRYGLLDAEDDDDDAFDDALDDGKPTPSPGRVGALRSPSPPSTARCVGELQRTPAYAAYLRSRGLTYRDVAATRRRLDLFAELRVRDAPSFAALVGRRPAAYESAVAPRASLALDWALGAGAGAFAGILTIWRELDVPPALRVATAVSAAVSAAAAVAGRSPVPDLWWESMATGGRAPGVRALAALTVDALYGAATLGVGAIVTLVARLTTRASLGDRLAGVRLVVERRREVEVG